VAISFPGRDATREQLREWIEILRFTFDEDPDAAGSIEAVLTICTDPEDAESLVRVHYSGKLP
jgi:hypothetical protein